MINEMNGQTQLICLLGSPVAHSKSPVMHNTAFQALNLNYAYLAFDVKEEQLERAVEGLKALGAKGFNLTMPNKNRICQFLDELSPAARIGGSVNTVVNEEGILKGYTTDGIGFMRSVEEDGLSLKGQKMTLLGAGGASVSILIQAALDGVREISVFSRRGTFFDRAVGIIEELHKQTKCVIHLYELSDSERLKQEILESKILVNGTSVGMAPNIEDSLITDRELFHKALYVYDVIYNPEETLLLHMAKEAGCRVQNGKNMLLYQGAAAFELWTGEKMPIQEVRQKIN